VDVHIHKANINVIPQADKAGKSLIMQQVLVGFCVLDNLIVNLNATKG